jgi:hypothetical protein
MRCREDLEDDELEGSTQPDNNVKKVGKMVTNDRRITIREVAEQHRSHAPTSIFTRYGSV